MKREVVKVLPDYIGDLQYLGDLCTSLKQRCRDNIDALDGESLIELAEMLLDPNDSEVVELRQLLQESKTE